jgi:CheY-like chemotaxis protein
MTVLIVDDDAASRTLIAEVMNSLGRAADSASGGEAALAAACGRRYDLVFMDICMPGMDGAETARRLRALPGYADAAVYALTALDSEDVEALMASGGFNGVIRKPFDYSEIEAAVAAVAAPAEAAAADAALATMREHFFGLEAETIRRRISAALAAEDRAALELEARRAATIAANLGMAECAAAAARLADTARSGDLRGLLAAYRDLAPALAGPSGAEPGAPRPGLAEAAARTGLDEAAAVDRLGIDPALYSVLLDLFEAQFASAGDRAAIAVAAGDLDRAIAQAHAVRGAAGNLGFAAAAAAAEALEAALRRDVGAPPFLPRALEAELGAALDYIAIRRGPAPGLSGGRTQPDPPGEAGGGP